ncbi:MAG: hypothetical protein IT367_05000 [Candidatus Hydrogenedentes bacterium]|nr:hypothetical protein [Candidatus Hydrogenedentota bacterium]
MTNDTQLQHDIPATATPPGRGVTIVAWALFEIVAGFVIFCAFFAGFPLNHDAAVMLQVGDVMRHGGIPYRDIIEITPPIAPALHIIPILIAETTSLSVPNAFSLFVTMLVAIACWQIYRLLRLDVFEFTTARRLLFLSAWLTGTLCVQLAMDYGQREHLFAVMLLPWLLCRIARHNGARIPHAASLSIGIVTSPFFLQKPFFLAVVGAMELALLVRSRAFRALVSTEIIALIAWTLAYALYLLSLPQDARDELRFLISFLSQHYGAYDGNFFDEENAYSHKWIAGVALVAIAMLRFYAPRMRAHVVALLAALVLCFAAYVIQGKGWFYHQIPVRMAATALLAFLVTSPRDTATLLNIKPYLRKIAAPICFAFLAMPIVYFSLVWHPQRAVRADYVRIMTKKILMHAAPGDYVTFISSDLRWAYPSVIYANVKLGSRYNIDFMAPMLYHDNKGDQGKPFPYRTANEQSESEKRYLQRRAEDVERFHPKFIAIDTNAAAQALPPGFRMSDYLDANGWQEVLKDYEPQKDLFCGFRFYERKDGK